MCSTNNINITEFQLELICNQHCCNLHRAKLLKVIWNHLSESQKQRSDSYQFCLEHYNNDNDNDQFDGPNPIKLNCHKCKMK